MLQKIISLMLVMLLLTGCAVLPSPTTVSSHATISAADESQPAGSENTAGTEETGPAPSTEEATADTTAPEDTEPDTTTVPVTEPAHSDLYIPNLSVEDVITYFNEVCLDAEFVNGGDSTLLQRWEIPIQYTIYGSYTDEDLAVLTGFTEWLNTIEGFPGIEEADESWQSELSIHFCTQDEMVSILGDNFWGMDGGVTFWYSGNNDIYNAVICYRTDIDQYVRNSVILEEIYNGLGPVQDTDLRFDSIIYSGYTTPQELTEIDELILKLLYHPDMQCGMNAAECEQIIRQLYY